MLFFKGLSNAYEISAKYPWNQLNKGTHEDSGSPEFEIKDVKDVINSVEKLENLILRTKFKKGVVLK